MSDAVPGRPHWVTKPLYRFLFEHFPRYRGKLEALNVEALCHDLNRSPECVYKWLRSGQLSRDGAQRLFELSARQDNRNALKENGADVPHIGSFTKFILAPAQA